MQAVRGSGLLWGAMGFDNADIDIHLGALAWPWQSLEPLHLERHIRLIAFID